jgi:hypothetical protein
MVSKNLLIAFAGGLAVIAIFVFGIFRVQKGAHLEIDGKILKVRSIGLDDGASICAVDFRATNPSDYRFMAQEVTVTIVDDKGHQTKGDTIPEIDAKRVFEGLPLLGPKYNPSLGIREVIPPRTTVDRMVAARFDLPDTAIRARKNLIVRIEEVDGAANTEFRER